MLNTKSSIFTSKAEVDGTLTKEEALSRKFQDVLNDLDLTNMRNTVKTYITSQVSESCKFCLRSLKENSGVDIPFDNLSYYLYATATALVDDILNNEERKYKIYHTKIDLHYYGNYPVQYPKDVEKFFLFEDNFKTLFVLNNYNKYKHLL